MAGAVAVYALGAAGVAILVRKAQHELAKYLANALADILDVDPGQIETSLNKSGKVVLNNVRLKPIYISSQLLLQGELDHIEFQWHWGAQIIKDATLTLAGVRLFIMQEYEEIPTNRQESSHDTHLPQATQDNGPAVGGTVQQILDQLTLKVSDFQLTIETPPQEQQDESSFKDVIIQARSIELVSLGREEKKKKSSSAGHDEPALLQELLIQSISAYIPGASVKSDQFWIMEPVGYKAVIRRVSGKRFGGVETGLEVIGQVMATEHAGIVIHAGATQVPIFLAVVDMFSNSFSKSADKQPAGEKDAQKVNASTDASLLVLLPVPTVKLVLPNETSIQTHSWQFRYHFDGTSFQLEGTGAGVFINDVDYCYLTLEDNVDSIIDFKNRQILFKYATELHDSDEASAGVSTAVAFVDWRESDMRPIMDGIRELFYLSSSPVSKNEDPVAAVQETNSSSKSSTPWQLTVDGAISIQIQGVTGQGETQWFQASLDRPHFVLSDRPDEIPAEISVQGAEFGPTSLADMTVRFAAVTLKSNSVPQRKMDELHQFLWRALGLDVWV